MKKERQSQAKTLTPNSNNMWGILHMLSFLLPVSQSDWDILSEFAWATSHHQPYDPETTAESTHC